MDSISPSKSHHQPLFGFTLIELMIVMLLISILLAYPLLNIQQQINRAYQLDGQMALWDLAHRMERYYAAHHTYLNASVGTGRPTDVLDSPLSPEGKYTLSIRQVTPSSYVLAARFIGTKINSSCALITLNSHGESTHC